MPFRFGYDFRIHVPRPAGLFALLRLYLSQQVGPVLRSMAGVNPAITTAFGQVTLTKFAMIEEMSGAV